MIAAEGKSFKKKPIEHSSFPIEVKHWKKKKTQKDWLEIKSIYSFLPNEFPSLYVNIDQGIGKSLKILFSKCQCSAYLCKSISSATFFNMHKYVRDNKIKLNFFPKSF